MVLMFSVYAHHVQKASTRTTAVSIWNVYCPKGQYNDELFQKQCKVCEEGQLPDLNAILSIMLGNMSMR